MTAGRAQNRSSRLSRCSAAASLGAVLVAVAGALAPAGADEPRRPFDRVGVALQGVASFGDGDFDDYWDAGRGVSLDAATPFYAGDLSAAIRFIHNDALSGSGTPALNAWGLWAGWWMGRNVTASLRVSLGASLGITQWHFPDADNDSLLRESEIGAEAGARIGWSFTPQWGVVLAGSLQRTYTNDRIDNALVSMGVVRTFGTPGWLRGWLE